MIKQLLEDHLNGWVYNTLSMLQNWYSKILCALFSFFGLHLTGFYGDKVLLGLLFKLMVIDLIVGVVDARKNRKWKSHIFLIRGMIKFPMYALYIYLVASLDHSTERILSVQVPVVEIFCLYLLAGEVYSISKHLRYLGFKVPEPLLWLSFGFTKKAEQKLKDLSGIGIGSIPDGPLEASTLDPKEIEMSKGQDYELEKAVRTAWEAKNYGTDMINVTAIVKEGVVTIIGNTGNPNLGKDLMAIAEQVPGVRGVKNELIVSDGN